MSQLHRGKFAQRVMQLRPRHIRDGKVLRKRPLFDALLPELERLLLHLVRHRLDNAQVVHQNQRALRQIIQQRRGQGMQQRSVELGQRHLVVNRLG